jgi:uncharacterized membrane protein
MWRGSEAAYRTPEIMAAQTRSRSRSSQQHDVEVRQARRMKTRSEESAASSCRLREVGTALAVCESELQQSGGEQILEGSHG